MVTPSFSLKSHDNLLLAKTTGDWDLSTDIAYLAEASDAMASRKGRPFYMLVDMRGWRVSDEVKYATIKETLVLDRRGQKGECWLMDSPHQGNYLLPYFSHFRFTLERVTTPVGVEKWMAKYPDLEFDSVVEEWITLNK